MADNWRTKRVPYFQAHLRSMYGRDPTDAELAGAVGYLEHGNEPGRKAVVDSFWGRQRTEGGKAQDHLRHYDPVALGHRWGSLSPEKIAPYASYYDALNSGVAQPTVSADKTHFFSPAGMRAYYNQNPSLVRSAVPMTVNGRTELIPNWATKAVAAGDYTNVGGEWFLAPNERYGKSVPTAAPAMPYNEPSPAHPDAVHGLRQPEKAQTMPIETVKNQQSASVVAPGKVVSSGGGQSRYMKTLAEALAKGNLTANPGKFEAITNALGRAVGTYSLGKMGKEDQAKLDEAVSGLPPELQPLGALDPKAAISVALADKRERATLDRDERKANANLLRDDAKAGLQERNARERLKLEYEYKQKIEAEKRAAEQAGGKGWKESIDPRTGAKVFVNPATGEARSRPPLDANQAPQPAPRPQSMDGTMPKPVAESVAPATEQQVAGTEAQVQPAAVTQVADKPAESKPWSMNGLVRNEDGTATLHGQPVSLVDANGAPIPEYIYKYAVERESTPNGLKAAAEREGRVMEKRIGEIDAAANAAQAVIPQLDAFHEANKNFKSGFKGDTRLLFQQGADFLGIELAGTSQAEVMRAFGLGMSKTGKDGLPGAVSNYEQKLFLDAVPSVSNTRLGNYLIGVAMRRSAERKIAIQQAAADYMERKRSAGLQGILDRGFQDHVKATVTSQKFFDDKEKQVLELIGKGKVKEAEALAFGDATPAMKNYSKDGTVKNATGVTPQPQTAPQAPKAEKPMPQMTDGMPTSVDGTMPAAPTAKNNFEGVSSEELRKRLGF